MSAAPEIAYADFEKIDVRVGTIVAAEAFPEARKPAFKLTIDFGAEIGVKRSSAQITVNHALDQLVGQQVLALGVPDAAGEVMLISPLGPVPNGGRLY